MHRALERDVPAGCYPTVLEVGGNCGEHVRFVSHGYRTYILSDLSRPALPERSGESSGALAGLQCDGLCLPIRSGTIDRVLLTCVIHHVADPLVLVREIERVLRPGGVASILVPTDPTLIFRLTRRLTSGRSAQSAGILERTKLIWALDHPNHYFSIAPILRYALNAHEVRVTWYPTRIPLPSMNLFSVWTVVKRGGDGAEVGFHRV
jgi:SAM-dependent methyltransferase